MSRPGPEADEPRLPRAERTVHRRPAAVPLRVVSRRVDRPADLPVETPLDTPVAPPDVEPPAAVVVPFTATPLPAPAVVGLPARVDAPARRGRPIARLVALFRGRRAVVVGRHRPGTLPSRGWSMFAPQRPSRRRFGTRR